MELVGLGAVVGGLLVGVLEAMGAGPLNLNACYSLTTAMRPPWASTIILL